MTCANGLSTSHRLPEVLLKATSNALKFSLKASCWHLSAPTGTRFERRRRPFFSGSVHPVRVPLFREDVWDYFQYSKAGLRARKRNVVPVTTSCRLAPEISVG